jgi:hypothetical protein
MPRKLTQLASLLKQGKNCPKMPVMNRTRQINTLHALFVHQGHTTVVKKQLATAERRQEAVKVLSGQEKEETEWILKLDFTQYAVLRNKTVYEPRPWKGVQNDPACLAEQTLRA